MQASCINEGGRRKKHGWLYLVAIVWLMLALPACQCVGFPEWVATGIVLVSCGLFCLATFFDVTSNECYSLTHLFSEEGGRRRGFVSYFFGFNGIVLLSCIMAIYLPVACRDAFGEPVAIAFLVILYCVIPAAAYIRLIILANSRMVAVFNGALSGLLLLLYELKNFVVAVIPASLAGFAPEYPLAQSVDLIVSSIFFPALALSVLGTVAALGKHYWVVACNDGKDITYKEPQHIAQDPPLLGRAIDSFVDRIFPSA